MGTLFQLTIIDEDKKLSGSNQIKSNVICIVKNPNINIISLGFEKTQLIWHPLPLDPQTSGSLSVLPKKLKQKKSLISENMKPLEEPQRITVDAGVTCTEHNKMTVTVYYGYSMLFKKCL